MHRVSFTAGNNLSLGPESAAIRAEDPPVSKFGIQIHPTRGNNERYSYSSRAEYILGTR